MARKSSVKKGEWYDPSDGTVLFEELQEKMAQLKEHCNFIENTISRGEKYTLGSSYQLEDESYDLEHIGARISEIAQEMSSVYEDNEDYYNASTKKSMAKSFNSMVKSQRSKRSR